ncbi:dolichyl-phosphate-mannose--protein mannosyltransferase [Tannerella sp. oral taxon 808]|nr:dolichyl-phosphate-mannose--protein mannosyltransferase [Tannerella sp. oral taxon 808]
MRASALQYLYLQKPVTTIVVLCLLTILPWIATGDFSTKGEPREASVAVSMLESGNWTLPKVYADEFAYKPPMVHWMMALASLPGGHVTELTARLPSAVAYTVLGAMMLIFLGRRVRFQEAFIAVCVMLTCVEIHRAGMTARVDMVLTGFIVAALLQMYRWEEKLSLKGLPIVIPLLLSGAVLTKGPVGIILPLFIFGTYLLLLRKYSLLQIFKALLYTAVASAFLPLLWYIAAWRQGGDAFLNVVLAENFGRFFHLSEAAIPYDLGHKEPIWYNLVTLAAGFLPWTLLLLFSLFGFNRKPHSAQVERPTFGHRVHQAWDALLAMDRVRLFSLVAAVCTVFFYTIPSSKRSVYLMPAYPFISLFVAQAMLYVAEHRSRCTRVFAAFIAVIGTVAFGIAVLTAAGALRPVEIATRFTQRSTTLETVSAVAQGLAHPSVGTIIVLVILATALLTVGYQMLRRINIKILYASLFLTVALNLFIDGAVMHSLRNHTSSRAFAERIRHEYPDEQGRIYVMNDLRAGFTNLYGLNFYLGNRFRNFDAERPAAGCFLSADRDSTLLSERFGQTYTFRPITHSTRTLSDVRSRVTLYRFERIRP